MCFSPPGWNAHTISQRVLVHIRNMRSICLLPTSQTIPIKNLLIFFCSVLLCSFSQEGSIGHDVVIKPVPTGIIDADSSSSGSATHHIVFKRKVDPVDQLSDFGMFFPFIFSYFSFNLVANE